MHTHKCAHEYIHENVAHTHTQACWKMYCTCAHSHTRLGKCRSRTGEATPTTSVPPYDNNHFPFSWKMPGCLHTAAPTNSLTAVSAKVLSGYTPISYPLWSLSLEGGEGAAVPRVARPLVDTYFVPLCVSALAMCSYISKWRLVTEPCVYHRELKSGYP